MAKRDIVAGNFQIRRRTVTFVAGIKANWTPNTGAGKVYVIKVGLRRHGLGADLGRHQPLGARV